MSNDQGLSGFCSPEESRAIYLTIRNRLAQRFRAAPALHSRLAIIGTEHLLAVTAPDAARPLGQRVLLYGPPGSGKTTAATALAHAIGLTVGGVWDATGIVEVGYRGVDIQCLVRELLISCQNNIERAETSVVVIDELDKLAIPSNEDSVAASARRGQQQSLLPFLSAEGEIRITEDAGGLGREVTIRTSRMLIIACGVFDGIRPTDATSGDLVSFGLTREISERIGIAIPIPASTPDVLVEIYRERADNLRRRFQRFGFDLEIPNETLRLLARIVSHHAGDAGSRSGAAWLDDAAQRQLVRMLDAGLTAGERVVLGPDDVDGALRARARANEVRRRRE